jgi:hypothetical protein
VGGDQLDHLARAHEQHADLAEVFEQLAGQAHGGGGHGDAVRADLGGAAHFLGDGKAALEQLVERGAQGACGLGARTAFFIWPRICASPSTMESSPRPRGRRGGRPSRPAADRSAGAAPGATPPLLASQCMV